MATKVVGIKKNSYRVWTVFLIKPEWVENLQFIQPSVLSGLTKHDITISSVVGAVLYVKRVPDITPPWVKRFEGIATPAVQAKSRSASAILVIETAGRTFALTFGFGRSIMDSEAWEQEFGLKVALS